MKRRWIVQKPNNGLFLSPNGWTAWRELSKRFLSIAEAQEAITRHNIDLNIIVEHR